MAGLLAACGGSGGGGTASTPTPAPTVAVKTGNPPSPVTLNESGSSLVQPYLAALAPQLKQKYPNITLTPTAGGSGKGISDAAQGLTQLGGSDAYLAPAQKTQYPGLMNIPIAISSQEINYNLPGVTNLKLTGDVLAKIYQGKITKWNDPAIAKLNGGTTLPDRTIIPVRRVDSSGDTFIFTSFLSATNSDWNNGPAFGTTVTWPSVSGELTASGNPAMIQVAQQNVGSIAYIGISVQKQIQAAGLGEAQLQNKAGKFVQPTQATVGAAVAASAKNVPADLAQPLIYAPGDQSYPIVNYEYLMVQSRQKDANTALAIRTFFTWAIDPNGGAYAENLAAVNFVALPPNVIEKVKPAINKIRAAA
jgi:phosphate transport system substrate-binding protein